MTEEILECDVLVIGAGLAGGIAALRAAELGLNVTLVYEEESASRWAQGGIVGASFEDPVSLAQDIFEAGCRRNFRPAVELVAESAGAAVKYWLLERLKVPFDVTATGELDLSLEAAHSKPRILHVKDFTGRAIMEKLSSALLSENKIRHFKGTLVDLLVSNRHDHRSEMRFAPGVARGAYVFDPRNSKVVAIKSHAVVLATGGFSQLYEHSTGPKSSRGDGLSAAHRAGARTVDLEYVQFHPTALYMPGEARHLLTEALRGAGARILNFEKKAFVDDLAPRDVVARAIHEELIRANATHVWLDLKAIDNLRGRFPSMVSLLESKGFDPQRELIPIVPAAHYTIGGVWTDLSGATNVSGLFAAGEVACTGLHGANRLASTSLLEALIFGNRAAESAARLLHDPASRPVFESPFEPNDWLPEHHAVDPALVKQDWNFLRQTLWNYVGLVRSNWRLKRAEKIVVELRNEVESFYKKSALNSELLGLRHGVLVATLLLYAAIRNRESVGTHYLRSDD